MRTRNVRHFIFILCLLPIVSLAQPICDQPFKGKKLTQQLVQSVLLIHQKWLDRGAKPNEKGKANFCDSDLSGLDLHGLNLSHANLAYANLSNANLQNTNLSFANAYQTYFRWSDLTGANFWNANFEKATLEDAKLNDADMRQANLHQANFAFATLMNAQLQGMKADGANFSGAKMKTADASWSSLLNANFSNAQLQQTNFENAKLNGANFFRTNLQDADFTHANLQGADLTETNLSNTNFRNANFKDVIYHPELNTLPNLLALSTAKNFRDIVFSPQQGKPALTQLTTSYKQIGVRAMERKITAMIKFNDMQHTWRRGGWGYLESAFTYVFFYITCDYGAAPGRPLQIFLVLIFLFAIPYRVALARASKRAGIIISWAPQRLARFEKQTDSAMDEERYVAVLRTRPSATWVGKLREQFRSLRIAMYFSLLSAFRIGWREDISVATWITRLQKRRYALKGKGWVRIFTGSQSIISAYLIVLWALTYFGRPFEW